MKFTPEDLASPEESRFNGAFRQAEASRCGRDIFLVKVEKDQGLSVLRRKGEDSPPHGAIAIFVLQSTVDGARIRRLGNLIQRDCHRRCPPEFGAIQVRIQCEKPRLKGCYVAP